ncbi:MAG: hypothetical protein ACI3XA_06680 [Clostridia bacterium]
MKKLKKRSILYFVLTLSVSLLFFAATKHINDGFIVKLITIVAILFLYIISFYDVAINGDKFVKDSEPELYEELDNARSRYEVKPMFISSYLIFSGRFRFFPKLKQAIWATVFYYLLVLVMMVTLFLILLL